MSDGAMNHGGRSMWSTAHTPQLKAKGAPGPFSASDLAVGAGRPCCCASPSNPPPSIK